MYEKNYDSISNNGLYDCCIDKAFEAVLLYTNYLFGINKLEVKTIQFSYEKDIFILLSNGSLTINGKFVRNNVNRLYFQDAFLIYSITNDNEIENLTGMKKAYSKFINNNHYKYKKIVNSVLTLAALTYDGQVRAISSCINVGILPESFINVDDIEYIVNEKNECDSNIIVK